MVLGDEQDVILVLPDQPASDQRAALEVEGRARLLGNQVGERALRVLSTAVIVLL